MDAPSIFNQYKQNESGRHGFMQIVKMDSGLTQDQDRQALIMTPSQVIEQLPSD